MAIDSSSTLLTFKPSSPSKPNSASTPKAEPNQPHHGTLSASSAREGSHPTTPTSSRSQDSSSTPTSSPALYLRPSDSSPSSRSSLFSDNSLVDGVPAQIVDCKKLEILNLGNNQFSGEVPSQLASLIRLPSDDFSNTPAR